MRHAHGPTARLSVRGTSCAHPVGATITTRVGVVLEAGAGRADVVGDDQVGALAPRACRWRSVAGRRSPPRSRPASDRGACAAPRAARMSIVGSSTTSGTPSAFLILSVGHRHGAEVGHGGRHDHDVGLGGPVRAPPPPSRRPSRPARPRRRRRHGQVGGGDERDRGAPGRGLVGHGVALLARRAVAEEAHRVDRLAGAAGGDEDHGARPGPGGAQRGLDRGDDRRPARPGGPRRRRRRRGGPPRASTMWTPRRRSVARLSCTAGCSHISVCIAGQTTTGARVASRVAVSRSSEMPVA